MISADSIQAMREALKKAAKREKIRHQLVSEVLSKRLAPVELAELCPSRWSPWRWTEPQ